MSSTHKKFNIPSEAAIASILAFYRRELGCPVEIVADDEFHFRVVPVAPVKIQWQR